MFENINIDWNLSHDDGSTDFSDDDTVIDERVRSIYNQYFKINIFYSTSKFFNLNM